MLGVLGRDLEVKGILVVYIRKIKNMYDGIKIWERIIFEY